MWSLIHSGALNSFLCPTRVRRNHLLPLRVYKIPILPTTEGAAVQGRKTVGIKSVQKPIPVEKREKPPSEAIVDSYKVDERERRKKIFAVEGSERVNLTKEAAGACFDNTGACRKQAFLELPSLGDSKELSASNHGVLQLRKPKEDKQVETLESIPAILKGEQKVEDITTGGWMNLLTLTIKNSRTFY